MPNAAYFRRQADICLRLSLIASDDAVSSRLVTMARDYMATSDAMARTVGTRAPAGGNPIGSPGPEPLDAASAAQHDIPRSHVDC